MCMLERVNGSGGNMVAVIVVIVVAAWDWSGWNVCFV